MVVLVPTLGATNPPPTASASHQGAAVSLRDLLAYLAARSPHTLTSTRIQKLVYLIDAENADRSGRRLTSYSFFYNDYGMYSRRLRNDARGIGQRDNRFEIEEYNTTSGHGFRLILRQGIEPPSLPPAIQSVCDSVLEQYGNIRSVTSLAAKAKHTLPFFGTERGKMVDWSILTDPCNRGTCNHHLSTEGRRAIGLD
jgi:hypothetical protein